MTRPASDPPIISPTGTGNTYVNVENVAHIEVKSSRPTVEPLMYCDFQVDPDSFASEDQAIAFIEQKLAGRYSAIREFNPDVDEITWNVKGDSELHKLSMLQLEAKRVR